MEDCFPGSMPWRPGEKSCQVKGVVGFYRMRGDYYSSFEVYAVKDYDTYLASQDVLTKNSE